MNESHKNSLHIQANQILLCLMLGFVIGISGCATASKESTAINKDDPYENFNRKVYGFNDKVDGYVAKPVADTYKQVTPDFVETGVSNFFNNLKSINVVLNDILQAKFEQSGLDTSRFLMNSTLGMAGLFDVAKSVGLEQNDEDFEQTLAVWGVPQGSYLVIPFLGPVTSRGIPGAVFDAAANPATYVSPVVPIQALSLINTRANAEGALKFIDEASLDPYVFTRESFLQWRNHLATDGKSETSSDLTDDIDAELLDDNQATDKKADSNLGGVIGAKVPSPDKNRASSASTGNKNTLQILPPDENGADKNPTGAAPKPLGVSK
ncbi:VacJ family lipoprotein [Methyloglobulus sp.]|uniref:MlaA family lipoprotein n=1 Tax=Methyloglobulus sp. TaxID=2518622 RepID=UPI0017D9D775|nr:VacJ family lipoprotein [Methyloglobulus sp.]